LGLFGFSKADRLLRRSEFIELSKNGKKIQNQEFIAIFSSSRIYRTRLGITASKRVGKANERNKIKRRIREFFRLNRHNISGFWDINIIVKKQAAGLSSDRVNRSLKDLFEIIQRHSR